MYAQPQSLSYKEKNTFEKRRSESSMVLTKYKDRIPIICEKSNMTDDIPNIDKKKYLVPRDFKFGQFSLMLRKRLKLSPEKALFIFVNNTLVPTHELMSNIYEKYKDEDGFLYCNYCSENTFG